MAGEPTKKISVLNDELDVKLFIYIAKRNILFPIAFIAMAIAGSYLYLRYTPPVFQTSAILQLGGESQANRFLSTVNIYEDDMAKQIELVRSSVFQQRALSSLPLNISFFTKGRVLNNELYKNTPFRVEARVKNSALYGTPINIDFIDRNKVLISYTINGQSQQRREFQAGRFTSLPDLDITVDVMNQRIYEEQQSVFTRNPYFFVLNNPETAISKYSPNIKINVLNAAARTILISNTGTNAQKASDIVNAMAEEFNVFDLEKKAESANNILEFIDRQLDVVFDQLAESEMELDGFKKEHNIDETTITPLPALHARIGDYENQIVMLELEDRIFTEIEQSLNAEEDIDIYKLIAFLSGSEFRGTISNLLRALQEQLMERERMLYEVTPNSRQIEALDYQISIQKRLLIESINALKNNIRSRIADLEGKIGDFEMTLASRSTRFNMIEFSRLQRIYSINERFYNQLVEKKAEYSISRAGFVSQSIILERSRPPSQPISPIARNVYLSSLAAIFLGAGIILLKYLFYNEIPSLHDILKYTNSPVLGVIPKYKSEIPPNQLLVLKKPKSLIAESLRAIRTNLQFINNEPGSKLVAVTSTISGEGKTFFAMNLAGILAFSDKKVIVIDLDMRKPKIHLGFNTENVKGVSTILSGIDQVDDCIKPSRVKNLDFITAGPVPPNPSELILTSRMDYLVGYLKERYDYVIIDNPPVGIVTDGMKSVLMAEYPIYIFKANYSKRIFIQNVNRLVSESNISKLSIVLNAVDREYSSYGYDKGYAYGYYGGYGYGYYEESMSAPSKTFFLLRPVKRILKKLFK
jgi:tyrosine-protein kinase Etk/Wzc